MRRRVAWVALATRVVRHVSNRTPPPPASTPKRLEDVVGRRALGGCDGVQVPEKTLELAAALEHLLQVVVVRDFDADERPRVRRQRREARRVALREAQLLEPRVPAPGARLGRRRDVRGAGGGSAGVERRSAAPGVRREGPLLRYRRDQTRRRRRRPRRNRESDYDLGAAGGLGHVGRVRLLERRRLLAVPVGSAFRRNDARPARRRAAVAVDVGGSAI